MKKTLSVLLVLCLAFSMIAGTAVAAEKPDSNEDILNRLSKEYDIAISLATEEEMNILGFKPSANRKETRIDEAFIRDAIETNLKYTADATKKMSSGDWNEYKLSPGQTYVAVEEPFQTASATKASSRVLYKKPWYPNGGRAVLDCDYDTSTCVVGTIYGLGFELYQPYEGTYHIIPATLGSRRIDGGRHVEMSCTGNFYVVSGGQLIKLGTASRTATIPC